MPSRKRKVQPKKKEEEIEEVVETVEPVSSSKSKKKEPVPKKEKKIPPPPKKEKKTPPPKVEKEEVEPEEKEELVSEDSEKKVRAPRKKVTMENYLERYDELLKILDGEVERKQREREKGARIFRSIRKTVRELKSDAPKLANSKRKVSTGEKRVSGLELKCHITDELADFMKLEHGSTPSRNDITNAICAYIHLKPDETREQVLEWSHLNPGGKRNLQNPQDRMKIIPDNALSKLLGYEQYKNDVLQGKVKETTTNKKTRKRETVTVTDPSLKYYVVQRLIRNQINGTFKLAKKD